MVQVEPVLAGFLAIVLFASLISKRTKTPYTVLLVLVGLALAAIPGSSSPDIVGAFNGLAAGGLFIGLILPLSSSRA